MLTWGPEPHDIWLPPDTVLWTGHHPTAKPAAPTVHGAEPLVWQAQQAPCSPALQSLAEHWLVGQRSFSSFPIKGTRDPGCLVHTGLHQPCGS